MPARRSRGDGSLYWDRSRKRWIAEVTIGYTASGKRIVKKASGKTKTAAQRKLKEIIRDYEDGLAIAPYNYTVADAVREWLQYGLSGRSQATVEKCMILANTHVIPALGARELRDLSANDVVPHRDPVTLTPTHRGAVPEPLAKHEQALAWFGAEHPVLLAVIRQAADRGFDAHSWRLAWSLEIFLSRQGYWHDWVAVQRRAVEAADRLGDRPAQAEMHRLLAVAHNSLRNHDDAHLHLRNALDLFEALGDRAAAARVLMDIGWVLESQNRHREALVYCERALDMFRAAGDRVGEASTFNGLGWCHAQLGDYSQAVAYCREALGINRAIGNRRGAAANWDSLGYAHHRLGEYEEAARCFQKGVDLYLELGVRYWAADTLVHLGDTHAAAGEPDAARDSWERALAIFDEIDHPDADEVRHKLSRVGDRR
jgi:tetratricopeptide (TPR) repeat protein